VALSKDKRDKVVAQALQELTFARRYKQGKIANWQKTKRFTTARKLLRKLAERT
jgi:hypothetical protein